MPFISQHPGFLETAQARLTCSCKRRDALINIIRHLEEKGMDSCSARRTLLAIDERIEIQSYHLDTLLRSRRTNPPD